MVMISLFHRSYCMEDVPSVAIAPVGYLRPFCYDLKINGRLFIGFKG